MIADDVFEYNDQTLSGFNYIICNGTASCHDTKIIFNDTKICNLKCIESMSCQGAIVNINNCTSSQIICNGIGSCDSMIITVTSLSNNQIIIDCGITQ
eukprot:398755_1